MADRFWLWDILLQFCRVQTLSHQPDASPRVAKALSQYTDGEVFHITTIVDAKTGEEAADATINAT